MTSPATWATALILAGCASTSQLRKPHLTPPLDVAILLPPEPEPIRIPPDLPRYPDRKVRTGQYPGLPAGILLSHAAYAEGIAVTAERNRLRLEVDALNRLRTEERAAAVELEQGYKELVTGLETRLRRAKQWRTGALVAISAAILCGTVRLLAR